MKPHDEPHGLCCVDPITAIMGGLGLGALMGGGNSTPAPAAAPTPPPAMAPPAQAAPPKPGAPATPQSSFIGGAAALPAQGQSQQKTLLGQ